MKAATTSRFHSPISPASRQRSASRRSMSSSRRSMREGRLLIAVRNVEKASDGIDLGVPIVVFARADRGHRCNRKEQAVGRQLSSRRRLAVPATFLGAVAGLVFAFAPAASENSTQDGLQASVTVSNRGPLHVCP